MYLVFRIFVPDMPPFCEEDNGTDSPDRLASSLKFIISQIPNINHSSLSKKAWYLIERIAGLKLFHAVFSIEDDEDAEVNYKADVLGNNIVICH